MKGHLLSDYDYDLPPELIAQTPVPDREGSRLLCLGRKDGRTSHRPFSDLPDLITDRDVLVLNNTRVIPGRLHGRKESGGKAEVLIIDYAGGREEENRFIVQCLVKSSKKPGIGSWLLFEHDLKARVTDGQKGVYTLNFTGPDRFEDWLNRYGHMPLPPYIKRTGESSTRRDHETYQTVYASQKGAVAAPTAGLHFSENLLKKIKSRGIKVAIITLHVGYGTFLPVRTSDIRKHKMHSERFSISDRDARLINTVKSNQGRVIAVGTTCVRTLEFTADEAGKIRSGQGECDLFIYPGYQFKTVDAMVTNFHLPESTLLMLVSAFAGREKIMAAYSEAIRQKYRFYSYGDAMFIS